MAENREYFTQTLEQGSIQISEDVVASVAASAVLEVEGVCGLNGSIGYDIAEMLGKRNLGKGIRLSTADDGALIVDCDVVAQFGQPVFDLAKSVQDAVKSSLESVTGLAIAKVNINICGIALPRDGRK